MQGAFTLASRDCNGVAAGMREEGISCWRSLSGSSRAVNRRQDSAGSGVPLSRASHARPLGGVFLSTASVREMGEIGRKIGAGIGQYHWRLADQPGALVAGLKPFSRLGYRGGSL